MPRLITSTPAARLSATRRSSSANMYGGIASRRLDGSANPIGAEIYSYWRVGSVQLGQGRGQLGRELARADRLGPAAEPHVELLGDLDLELAAVEHDHQRAGRPAQDGRHGGAAGAGSRRQ